MRSPYADMFTRLVANTQEPANGQACWIWSGKRDRGWYGRVNVYVPGLAKIVTVMSHISLWACFHAQPATADEFYLAYIEIVTSGLELDHICTMPPCCNPDHLELVTPRENCRRRDERRRSNFV